MWPFKHIWFQNSVVSDEQTHFVMLASLLSILMRVGSAGAANCEVDGAKTENDRQLPIVNKTKSRAGDTQGCPACPPVSFLWFFSDLLNKDFLPYHHGQGSSRLGSPGHFLFLKKPLYGKTKHPNKAVHTVACFKAFCLTRSFLHHA